MMRCHNSTSDSLCRSYCIHSEKLRRAEKASDPRGKEFHANSFIAALLLGTNPCVHQQDDSRCCCCRVLILPSDFSEAVKHVSTPPVLGIKNSLPELQQQQAHTSQISTQLETQINRRRQYHNTALLLKLRFCWCSCPPILLHFALLQSEHSVSPVTQPPPPVTVSLWHLSQAFILIRNSAISCSDHWLYCRSLRKDPYLWLTSHKGGKILLKYHLENAMHEKKQLAS